MTESDQTSPEEAPQHTDVRAQFSTLQLGLIAVLGGLAIVIGTVLGLVLAND